MSKRVILGQLYMTSAGVAFTCDAYSKERYERRFRTRLVPVNVLAGPELGGDYDEPEAVNQELV